jgi:hypothetical protein
MQVNEGIVVEDLRMVGGNETHATHISSQGVYLIDTLRGLQAILPLPKIKQQKLIGIATPELGRFQIHTPDPVALTFKIGHQVVTNKTPGSSDDDLLKV